MDIYTMLAFVKTMKYGKKHKSGGLLIEAEPEIEMYISFTCKKCGKKLKTPVQHGKGEYVICNKC